MTIWSSSNVAAFVALVAGWWVASLISARWTYKQRLKQYQAEEVPRYPNKDPIFGLDFFFVIKKAFETSSFLQLNYDLHEKYGKTYQVIEMGKTVIKSVDSEVSKAFHSTNFDDLGVRPGRRASGMTFFGPSITNDDGHFWQTRRAWLRPSFEKVHLMNFERLQKHIDKFVALLPDDGSTVDLRPLFARFNLDTSSEFIFGESLDAIANPSGTAKFQQAFKYAVRGVAIKHMMGPWLMHLHRDKAFIEARDEVYAHVDARVDEALQRHEQRLQTAKVGKLPEVAGRLRLIDELVMETQDRSDLRYLLIATFNPGHKQMSIALTNIFFLLARNPEVYEQLRVEIMPSSGEELSYQLLKSYKLVGYTIKEASRLLSISSFNQREALRDTVFPTGGGKDGRSPLYLPRGTVIEIQSRAMHRRPEIWGVDADKFKPQRWANIRPGYGYVPFGGGPRACPAQEFVFTEIAFTLVTMLRKFKAVENKDPVCDWKERMNMGFESANGAKVALHRA